MSVELNHLLWSTLQRIHFLVALHTMKNLSSPSTVYCLHRLHSQGRGHQIIGIVSSPTDHQQTFYLPHHKDQTALHTRGGGGDNTKLSDCTVREECFVSNQRFILTGPTKPRSPDRTNGISPMGTPLALTGITWTQQKDTNTSEQNKRNRLYTVLVQTLSGHVLAHFSFHTSKVFLVSPGKP